MCIRDSSSYWPGYDVIAGPITGVTGPLKTPQEARQRMHACSEQGKRLNSAWCGSLKATPPLVYLHAAEPPATRTCLSWTSPMREGGAAAYPRLPFCDSWTRPANKTLVTELQTAETVQTLRLYENISSPHDVQVSNTKKLHYHFDSRFRT